MRPSLIALVAILQPGFSFAEDDYVPLAVGLRREAVVEVKNDDGETVRGKVVREVLSTEVIGGRTYLKEVVTVSGVPGLSDFHQYRRKAADGIYAINSSDPDRKEYLEIPLPLKVGKEWTIDTQNGRIKHRVEAKEAVTVGSKKYDGCYQISYRNEEKSIEAFYFLALDRGNVREEIRFPAGKVLITLSSFELKKP